MPTSDQVCSCVHWQWQLHVSLLQDPFRRHFWWWSWYVRTSSLSGVLDINFADLCFAGRRLIYTCTNIAGWQRQSSWCPLCMAQAYCPPRPHHSWSLMCPVPLSTQYLWCLYITTGAAGVLLGKLVPCTSDKRPIVLTLCAKAAQRWIFWHQSQASQWCGIRCSAMCNCTIDGVKYLYMWRLHQ